MICLQYANEHEVKTKVQLRFLDLSARETIIQRHLIATQKVFVFIYFFWQYANEREVKAQVRLQFHDVSGQQTIVQRSMTATQKVLCLCFFLS